MNIIGFQPTTLLDYPGKVACTIFTGGCNFRCPFCQNPFLVLGKMDVRKDLWKDWEESRATEYPEDDILAFLKKRKNVHTGVCVTGGEPTLQKNLPEFLCQIKDLGYAVKLDTNGYHPEILKQLWEGHLIDYVAMDIKSSLKSYADVCGLAQADMCGLTQTDVCGLTQTDVCGLVQEGIDFIAQNNDGCNRFHPELIRESVSFLSDAGVPHEFRTTLVKGLHTPEDMKAIGKWLPKDSAYYLQSYQNNNDIVLGKVRNTCPSAITLDSFTEEELQEFLNVARSYIPNTSLRGVD